MHFPDYSNGFCKYILLSKLTSLPELVDIRINKVSLDMTPCCTAILFLQRGLDTQIILICPVPHGAVINAVIGVSTKDSLMSNTFLVGLIIWQFWF